MKGFTRFSFDIFCNPLSAVSKFLYRTSHTVICMLEGGASMDNTVRAIIVIIVLEFLGSIYFIFDIIKTYRRERRIAWKEIIEDY